MDPINDMEKKSANTRQLVVTCIGLLCIFLFIYTGYSKLTDHDRFLTGLTHVKLIGRYAVFISWLVPVAELAVAALMIMPWTFEAGLKAFTGLMILFTCYIAAALIGLKELPCRCGGAIEKLSWAQHLWFNLAFIVLAAVALRISRSKPKFKK